jgi:hypothetical protein
MRKDKKLGLLSHCDGGTSAEPHCLLAEVYQLLNGYAPVTRRTCTVDYRPR